jgi:hypothetical protein
LNRIKLSSIVAAGVLGLAGLIGAAAPANALTTVTVTVQSATGNNDTGGPAVSPPGTQILEIFDELRVENKYPNASITISGTCVPLGGAINQTILSQGIWTATAVADGFCTLTVEGPAQPDGVLFVLVDSSLPPTPAPVTNSVPTPETFELSLIPTDGTTCTKTSESGPQGAWMTLPSANDCTPPASKPGATLLGWATSPNFPVDIAQRQVDNGWGAYETFNADGQLTGVFIPAGGATLLSASGNLFPIWS